MLELTCCPLEYVTADVWEAIRFAALYEKGLPPIGGGALDQCNVFLAAVEMIRAEQERWKRELR